MKKEYALYLLKKTKEDYNLIADDFSRTRNKTWEELGFLVEGVRPNETILDLGCGNGRLYELFKGRMVGYFGIDNSEKLIALAKNRYPGVSFQAGDALNLPFSDNFFDEIFSIAVLHHVPSKELRLRFLKEARRVLKPNGSLILIVWNFHQIKERCLLFKYTILKLIGISKLDWKDILEPWGKKIERYYHWFSKKELENLVKKAGLKVERKGIIKNEKGNRQNIYLIAKK